MKILISGATGFIGQHLCKLLVLKKIELCCLVRETSNLKFLKDNNINYFIYNGKTETIIDYIKDENYDGMIHLASLFISEHHYNQIDQLIKTNLLFGTKLLEAAVLGNVKWFINTGTFWQHYNGEKYNPTNLYAASKQAFETIARFYVETSNIIFTTIKLNDTFGEGDNRKKIFNLWAEISESGQTLKMSAGEQLIDIVHVDEVVKNYLKLAKILNNKKGKQHNLKSYYITSGKKIPLKELALKYENENNVTLNIEWGARNYRKREVMDPMCYGEDIDSIN